MTVRPDGMDTLNPSLTLPATAAGNHPRTAARTEEEFGDEKKTLGSNSSPNRTNELRGGHRLYDNGTPPSHRTCRSQTSSKADDVGYIARRCGREEEDEEGQSNASYYNSGSTTPRHPVSRRRSRQQTSRPPSA